MRFVSTRGGVEPQTLSNAITAGLAPDGGLFVPEQLPQFSFDDFAETQTWTAVSKRLLRPFFHDDALRDALDAIVDSAFDFELPLRQVMDEQTAVLELFHGPTAAFKDVGARFLARCMEAIQTRSSLASNATTGTTILVATSGDTGAAVGAAFHLQARVRVVILYPDGRVSPRQAHQLGCFGDNVQAIRVQGSFDDCQAMVKAMFNDAQLRTAVPLGSANSISLGRLLPQMSYYAFAALKHHRAHGSKLGFVVPTGNLGNAFAAILVRAMGLPVGRIVLATNANRVLPEFLSSGNYQAAPSLATLANAMDVGDPSNAERLRWLHPNILDTRAWLSADSVDDAGIQATMVALHQQHGEVICPHTACGFTVLKRLREHGETSAMAVVATAHPAKFESIVEPLLARSIQPPPALAAMLARDSNAALMPAETAALAEWLRQAHLGAEQ